MDRPLRFSRSSPQLDSVDPSISRRSLLPDLGSVTTNDPSSSPLDLNHDNDGKDSADGPTTHGVPGLDSLAEPVDHLVNDAKSDIVDPVLSTVNGVVNDVQSDVVDPVLSIVKSDVVDPVLSIVSGVVSTVVDGVGPIFGGAVPSSIPLPSPSISLSISASLSLPTLPISLPITPSITSTSATIPTTPPPTTLPPTSSLTTVYQTSQNTDSASDVVTSTSTPSTEASMSRESLTSLSLTASFAITSDTSISIHSEKLFVSPTTNPAYGEDEGDGDSSGGGIGGLPGGPSPVRPDATGSPSPTDPTYPPGSPPSPPSLPPAKRVSFALGTLVLFIVFGAGLFWWKKRQNKNGVNMFGRRLELGETPDAWNRLEEGGGGGGRAEVEKNNNTKEASRTGNDMGYGTMQRGGVSINNSFPPEERRRKRLPIITPILTWMKSRTRPGTHGAKEKYGTNSRTLPRSGRTLSKRRRRQSLSPVSLPSSSNTSLRSGSYISSDENDISLYMHVMHDDDSLSIPSPEPSPRSLSMSTGSRLSRISGSTDEVSEFEAVPGRTGGRKRRDSEHSSISEETSDTRSSFGFVRPVVSATGGAGPSTFTATGHYSTGNGSTTTLTPSSPPPASDPGGSNLSSPYGPGLDFFTARAWKKHPTAGPSLMEVVNSLSTPGGDNHGGMRPVSRGNNNQNPL